MFCHVRELLDVMTEVEVRRQLAAEGYQRKLVGGLLGTNEFLKVPGTVSKKFEDSMSLVTHGF